MRRVLIVALLALAVAGVAAGTATATPPSGVTSLAAFRTNVGSVDLVVQIITIAPGGTTGWHMHPGLTRLQIMGGTATLYMSDCTPQVYPAGSAFVEAPGEVGVLRNEGAVPLVFLVFQQLPPGAAPRIDTPNPGCPGVS